jgi:hypothetical protein
MCFCFFTYELERSGFAIGGRGRKGIRIIHNLID